MRRFTACVALVSAFAAGAGATVEAPADATTSEFVGTWYVGEVDGGRTFWWEITLYEDGTYCEMTFRSDSEERSPFSLSVGRWNAGGGYLTQQADRSTNPHQVQDVGEQDRTSEITAVESVSRDRLVLRSLVTHGSGMTQFERQPAIRRKEACEFPKALPEDAR